MNPTPLLFNPRSADFRANPYPTYEYLRNNHPIYYRPEQKDWVLTRYADVAKVLKDSGAGRSENKDLAQTETPKFNHPFLNKRYESQQLMALWLLFLNPPEHKRIRDLLKSPFTPSKIQSLKSYIEGTIDSLIDKVQDLNQMDLIADFAYPLTLSVNCKVLGIPSSEWHPNFKQWLASLLLLTDLDVKPIDTEKGMLAIIGLADYFRGLIRKYQHSSYLQQQNNLINTLIKAENEGSIKEKEVIGNCIFLFFGGHSTTVNLIGLSMLHLFKHPAQMKLLKANPSLIKTTIAEVLRYDNPIQATSRTLFKDIQLAGQILHQGETVHCIIGSANRDPEKFLNPEKFEIARNPNPYLSFGQGIHTCIGKRLANLVAETAIAKLINRLPELDLPSESSVIKWDDSFVGRSLTELNVIF